VVAAQVVLRTGTVNDYKSTSAQARSKKQGFAQILLILIHLLYQPSAQYKIHINSTDATLTHFGNN